ncbi:Imm7 family immunity protein [Amycolatopsis suaedae]|uniref:Immunity protein 7 n=1 Tax=Amycolatopsis suaedae TaxID=2510978 RepID=A0A4Q7J3P9_9PSEU|nr:Imm7 family immunity protein [Amycolatopsis suaedae]RZQ62130.1 hypothetical protein EWH70_21375 [Amycolatopsis suaedae]
MYEYHGWVTIQVSADESEPDGLLDRAVERVGRLVREFAAPGLVDLRWANGVPVLHLGGVLKRPSTLGPELIRLFARVGELAPGSYGLLYVLDDEDFGHDNEFRVYRMARGQVTERADPFLTPVVPTILEDVYADA